MGETIDGVLNDYLDEIRGTWSDADPRVLAFGSTPEEADDPDEPLRMPVVAIVEDEPRVMSSSLIYPRHPDRQDLVTAINRRGEPMVRPLSKTRFDREAFEDLPEGEDDG